MKAYKLEFRQNYFTKQWRWKIKATNGKNVANSSESFKNKADCEHNAEITGFSIQKHFSDGNTK